MDFTIKTYQLLLTALKSQGFSFLIFDEFVSSSENKAIVLRHDVDALSFNSLQFARIQAEMGIRGTYYFRIVPDSFDEKIIKEIYSLGHEVGYHYEDVGTMAQRHKGTKAEEELVELAIKSFKENLERLRLLVPIKTICMHGSPMSRWDSRLLWKYYDYHDFGIIGEPYFDIDFNEVLYLTDTGRRWDGNAVSIRDRADGMRGRRGEKEKGREENPAPCTSHPAPCTLHPATFPKFHSTFDIIKAANEGLLPDKIMMTFHPQRWTDKPGPWLSELVLQNVKNVGKYFLIKRRTTLNARHREKG